MQLDERELGAVLAGLRLLQDWRDGIEPDAHLVFTIATDNFQHRMPTDDEINALCERLNTTPDAPEWAFDIVMQLAEQNLAPEWDDDTAGQRVLQEEALDLVRDYLHQNKIWR